MYSCRIILLRLLGAIHAVQRGFDELAQMAEGGVEGFDDRANAAAVLLECIRRGGFLHERCLHNRHCRRFSGSRRSSLSVLLAHTLFLLPDVSEIQLSEIAYRGGIGNVRFHDHLILFLISSRCRHSGGPSSKLALEIHNDFRTIEFLIKSSFNSSIRIQLYGIDQLDYVKSQYLLQRI